MKFDTYGEPLEDKPIKLIATIDVVRTTSDGGAKITLECGADSMEAVQKIFKFKTQGDVLLAIAVVPYRAP